MNHFFYTEGEMLIQNPLASPTPDGRIAFQWQLLGKPIALSVQVALDSEFTQEAVTFVLPNTTTQVTLDVGPGNWFYRVGSWIGTQEEGVIEWTGIYGPVGVQSKKPRIRLEEFSTFLTHVQPALNSIVFHTGLNKPYRMIVHLTDSDDFRASRFRTHYFHDWGSGTITVPNLDPAKTYSFGLQMLAGADALNLPTDTIRLLTETYSVKKKRTGMPVKAKTGTERATYAADQAMLRDAVGKPSQKFFSYTHYLQFQAAKARTSASQQ